MSRVVLRDGPGADGLGYVVLAANGMGGWCLGRHGAGCMYVCVAGEQGEAAMKRIKEERPDIATVIVLPTVGRQAGREARHAWTVCLSCKTEGLGVHVLLWSVASLGLDGDHGLQGGPCPCVRGPRHQPGRQDATGRLRQAGRQASGSATE